MVARRGRTIRVLPPADVKAWELFLAGIEDVEGVENGAATPAPHGTLVTPAVPGGRVVVQLPNNV